MSYDVVGDIHGHATKLEELLELLGYQRRPGGWRHPQRTAVFVGDFVDRGPGQLHTLEIVRDMVESGAALAIMGNHEFNAVCWHTEDPECPGEFLRPRSGKLGQKNRKRHEAFLSEVEHDPALHSGWIEWFRSLPLWLELDGLRVVHACWHEGLMTSLAGKLTGKNSLPPELFASASRRGSDDYLAVQAITKGLEVALPDGLSFRDKDGVERKEIRVRWWDPEADTYRKAAMLPPQERARMPDTPLPAGAVRGYSSNVPVIFGHYWMTGEPALLSPQAACVDYSAGKGGPLVAYRWGGEKQLCPSHFVAAP